MSGQIGIDTCFLIDFFKGEKNAIEFFEKNASRFVIHDLVVFEFLCGNLSKKQSEVFQEAIQVLQSIALTRGAIVLGAQILRDLKKKGNSIGSFDALLSAGYLNEDVKEIVTRNEKHFAQTNLRVVKY